MSIVLNINENIDQVYIDTYNDYALDYTFSPEGEPSDYASSFNYIDLNTYGINAFIITKNIKWMDSDKYITPYLIVDNDKQFKLEHFDKVAIFLLETGELYSGHIDHKISNFINRNRTVLLKDWYMDIDNLDTFKVLDDLQ